MLYPLREARREGPLSKQGHFEGCVIVAASNVGSRPSLVKIIAVKVGQGTLFIPLAYAETACNFWE